jgi:polysaccharide transporter, PST family
LIGYGIVGTLVFVFGFILAPFVINTMFGAKYQDGVIYFRYLLILVPLISINTVLAYHVLIPAGRERSMTQIYIAASLLSAASIYILVPKYLGYGMVVAMVLPEIFALVVMAIVTLHSLKTSQKLMVS